MPYIHNPAMFFIFQHPAFGGLYRNSDACSSSSSTRVSSTLSEFLFDQEVNTLLGKVAATYVPSHPYHNLRHAQHVTDSVDKLACMYEVGKRDRFLLVLAAMFHDAGHSGGELPDVENVKIASGHAFRSLSGFIKGVRHEVAALISVTAFDSEERVFIKEPTTLSEKILRDADLLGFQYQDWPDQLAGLATEMSIKVDTVDRALFFLKEHLVFMRSVPMYTEFGKSVKDKYVEALTEALTCFTCAN